MSGKVRVRVKELIRVKKAALVPHGKNPRVHADAQRSAFQALLEDVGFAGALLARKKHGTLYLIDGHMRLDEVADDVEIPVLVTDLTEKEANELLLLGNRVGEMAELDAGALEALVSTVELQAADLQELVSAMLDETQKDRSPGHSSNKDKQHGVIVTCKDENAAAELYRRLDGEGFECRTVARAAL